MRSIFTIRRPCPNPKCHDEVMFRLSSFRFECGTCPHVMPELDQARIEAELSRRARQRDNEQRRKK